LRCKWCRGVGVPKVTPALRAWWLERFTLGEIRELATAILGVQSVSGS
jgi:hypothetical protein